MASRASGWCVLDRAGAILINTVTDSRRSSIMNWLVGECKIAVVLGTTDARIEEAWARLRPVYAVEVVPVTITAPIRSVVE